MNSPKKWFACSSESAATYLGDADRAVTLPAEVLDTIPRVCGPNDRAIRRVSAATKSRAPWPESGSRSGRCGCMPFLTMFLF
jgi:hypothetical protein